MFDRAILASNTYFIQSFECIFTKRCSTFNNLFNLIRALAYRLVKRYNYFTTEWNVWYWLTCFCGICSSSNMSDFVWNFYSMRIEFSWLTVLMKNWFAFEHENAISRFVYVFLASSRAQVYSDITHFIVSIVKEREMKWWIRWRITVLRASV